MFFNVIDLISREQWPLKGDCSFHIILCRFTNFLVNQIYKSGSFCQSCQIIVKFWQMETFRFTYLSIANTMQNNILFAASQQAEWLEQLTNFWGDWFCKKQSRSRPLSLWADIGIFTLSLPGLCWILADINWRSNFVSVSSSDSYLSKHRSFFVHLQRSSAQFEANILEVCITFQKFEWLDSLHHKFSLIEQGD